MYRLLFVATLALCSGCSVIDDNVAAGDATIALRPFAPPGLGRYVMDVVDPDDPDQNDRVEGAAVATVTSSDPSLVSVLLSWPGAPDQGLGMRFDRAELERSQPGDEVHPQGVGFLAPGRGQWSGLDRVTVVEGTDGALDVRFAVVLDNPSARYVRLRLYGRFAVSLPPRTTGAADYPLQASR